MSWKKITAIVLAVGVVGLLAFRMVPGFVQANPPPDTFLDSELTALSISQIDALGVTVRELHDYYAHAARFSTSWERLDQERFVLHVSGQDSFTRQSVALAWEFSSVGPGRGATKPNVNRVFVDRLAAGGEVMPNPMISRTVYAIMPEVSRMKENRKR